MIVRAVTLSVATLLASALGSVAAHHSFAMFDMQKEVKLAGTVKDYQWTNPHIWIQLLVKDASGKEGEWAVECIGASAMGRQGWTRKTLKAGDKISMVIHPLKTSTEPGGSLVSATINGQSLRGGGGGTSSEATPAAALAADRQLLRVRMQCVDGGRATLGSRGWLSWARWRPGNDAAPAQGIGKSRRRLAHDRLQRVWRPRRRT